MNRCFKILTINVASIRTLERRAKLTSVLNENKNPHVVLIQETNLNDRNKLTLPLYNIVRTDANWIGTAIAVKNNIDYKQVEMNTKLITCTAITIKINGLKHFICSIYIPHRGSQPLIRNECKEVLNIAKSYDACIVGGDFNAIHTDWNNTNCCHKGEPLAKLIREDFGQLSIVAPNTQTRYESNVIIDFFIIIGSICDTDFEQCSCEIKTVQSFSDHFGVLLTLMLKNRNKIMFEPPEIKKFINYEKTDWKNIDYLAKLKFEELNLPNDRNLTVIEIDKAVDEIKEIVKHLIENVLVVSKSSFNILDDLPNSLKSLILERKRMKNKLNIEFQRAWDRNTNKYKELRSCIRAIDKMIKCHVSLHKENCLERTLEKIELNSSCFAKINRLTGRKSKQSLNKIKVNNIIFSNKKDISEIMAAQFLANFLDKKN